MRKGGGGWRCEEREVGLRRCDKGKVRLRREDWITTQSI